MSLPPTRMIAECECANITRMGDMRWRVEDELGGRRLVKFLSSADRLGSRRRALMAIQRGKVVINDAESLDPGRRLSVGDEVRVWMSRPGTASRRTKGRTRPGGLEIVYEDEGLIIVNKPPGLLAVPLPRRHDAPSVEELLVDHLRSRGKRRPLVVHRIDRDTSGLVLFATRQDVQQQLKGQFRRHEPERVYLAVLYGHPSPPEGTWRDRLVWDQRALIQKETHPHDPRGSVAQSNYRVVEAYRDASLVEIRLVTGKRNQIRLQARLRGHMLVGERRYVYGPGELRAIEFPRQALHASRLGFRHPVDGRLVQFDAPLPPDIAGLVAGLKLN